MKVKPKMQNIKKKKNHNHKKMVTRVYNRAELMMDVIYIDAEKPTFHPNAATFYYDNQ